MKGYCLQVETVNKQMLENSKEKKYKHHRRKKVRLLPFPTREPERAQLREGFMPIVAGSLRKLQSMPIDSYEEKSLNEVFQQFDFKDETAKKFLENYIESERSIVANGTIHDISQLTAVPLSDRPSEAKGEKELIHFVHDVFLYPYRKEFLEALDQLEANNIIFQLLEGSSERSKKDVTVLYPSKFPLLAEQFKNDFLLLLQHQRFLVEHIELLFVQYTYVAISELILQVSRMEQFDEENWMPFYFFYQEEKSARWRDGYKFGYRMIRDQLKNFFVHEHLLNVISQIEEVPDNSYYHEVQSTVQAAGDEAVKAYIDSIEQWMREVYCVFTKSNHPFKPSQTIEELYQKMYKQMKPNISGEVNSRYPKGFEELFNRFFYKHGGSLGKLNGLDQRQVLLLVAVSVGTKRLELNALWNEFEKRGVYMDYKTKEVIVELLDSLNYIEKQSDSGDAQYVKPIL